MSTLTIDDARSDAVENSVADLLSRALDKPSSYFKDMVKSLTGQATQNQTRADLIKSQIANLSEITAQAYAKLSTIDKTKFDVQMLARYEALKLELAKVDKFISASKLASSFGDNFEALGKSTGAIIGSLEFLSNVKNNASEAEVSRSAVIAGSGMLLGMFTGGGFIVAVGFGTLGSQATKHLWDNYATPWLKDKDIDLSRPFWDALHSNLAFGNTAGQLHEAECHA